MAKSYRVVDRDQQFLLPVDMREWLPPGHLVWFVLSVVEQIDKVAFHGRNANDGAGRAAFDPDMLLALLIYGYCQGVRSSRQIERLCEVDVAFRVVCAQDVPDHTTIARFRQRHDEAFESLFVQVLALAARAGLGRFGTIAIDGTKIAANASLDANRSEAWLREQVEAILAEAEQVDAAEDAQHGLARGDELPEDLAEASSRTARIRAALEQIEAERVAAQQLSEQQVARAEQRMVEIAEGRASMGRDPGGVDPAAAARLRLDLAVAAQQAKVDAYAAAMTAAITQGVAQPVGRRPVSVQTCAAVREAQERLERAVADAADQAAARQKHPEAAPARANTTDPDSRIMPTRRGWIQGYNVQVSVTGDQLILATSVGQSPVDNPQLLPMMDAAQRAVDIFGGAGGRDDVVIGTVLADAGYASNDNLTAPGADRLIALGKARAQHADATARPAIGEPPADATARQAMDHRLRTAQGSALYKRRGATVEPAIGNLKKIIDRFSRRGLSAACAEIDLAATAFNLLKIHRAAPALA